MQNPLNFEDVRKRSSNGKKRIRCRIGLAYGDISTRRDHRRAVINIDLFPGSMDLKVEAADALRTEYEEYMKAAAPRKGRITNLHSHFNRRTIWFEVRPEDAGTWFRKVLAVLSDPEFVVRAPEPFEGFYKTLEQMA
jgi:hypothetical protein